MQQLLPFEVGCSRTYSLPPLRRRADTRSLPMELEEIFPAGPGGTKVVNQG